MEPLTTSKNAKVKKFAFKGDPSYVNILKLGDIEAVTLSNNHSEDYFDEGIKDTKFVLDENSINYFGLGEVSKIIIGSHPHVIQGIEKYKDKYIAYSLGNFCFGGNKNPADKDSLIYQLTFNFENNKLVGINEPNIIPCSISSDQNRNNYQPTPTTGLESERIINKLKYISKSLNI